MSGLLALLRIARRDARRAKGRSALIVLMVALPLVAVTFAAVTIRSEQLDPDERVSRELGTTQARLEVALGPGAGMAQDPLEPELIAASGEYDPGAAPALADLAPPGTRTLTEASTSVRVRTAAGTGTTGWIETDAADPAFRGRWVLERGARPAGVGEVLVTPRLLDRLGVGVGAEARLVDPDASVRVAGVVRLVDRPAEEAVVALPGALGALPGRTSPAPIALFVDGPDPVTWPEVVELNAQGATALSRAVLLDPPADEDVPFRTLNSSSDGTLEVLLVLGLVGGLAGLEVVLLAGAAFAVGARRQAHALALLAAAGGTRRQVRSVVLAGGVVLGLVAAAVGLAGGLLAAAVARPVIEHYGEVALGRYDVRPLELGVVVLLGLVTAVLAAALPARTAARQDPVAVLAGRGTRAGTPKRVPVVAVVMTVLGAGASAVGSTWALALVTSGRGASGSTAYAVSGLIAGGSALALLGLVVLSPAVIGLAGRLAGRLPLAPRLALRDAARHRGRSAPAMAAVMAAVAGSTAITLYLASLDDHNERTYRFSQPYGTAAVPLQVEDFAAVPYGEAPRTTPVDPVGARAALEAHLPVSGVRRLVTPAGCYVEGCTSAVPVVPEENLCPDEAAAATDDWRCAPYAGATLGTVIGGPEVLRAVTGTTSPEAERVLTEGGVVSSRRAEVDGGRVRFDLVVQPAPGAPQEAYDRAQEQARQVELPAALLDAPQTAAPLVVSPEAAEALGMRPGPGHLLATLDHPPSQDEQDAAAAALDRWDAGSQLVVERGYVSSYGLGLLVLAVAAGVITLGATGISTGLAQADARADHATLAAVGAAPRLRRALAGSQALVVAALGGALGIAAGFVPALAYLGADPDFEVVLPWASLGAVLVGVPLLAGAGAWLCTRSRLPLTARRAL